MRQIPLNQYPPMEDREAWEACPLPWGNYTTGAPRGPWELECLARFGAKVRLPGGGTISGKFSTTGFTVGARETAAKALILAADAGCPPPIAGSMAAVPYVPKNKW